MTKVRYQFVGRRGKPAQPDAWIERQFPEWPRDDFEKCARLVVGAYISGRDGSVWPQPIVCIFHTVNGFEFDAQYDSQHFIVECPTGGPW